MEKKDRSFGNSRSWLMPNSRWHLSGFMQHTVLDPDDNLLCQPEFAETSVTPFTNMVQL